MALDISFASSEVIAVSTTFHPAAVRVSRSRGPLRSAFGLLEDVSLIVRIPTLIDESENQSIQCRFMTGNCCNSMLTHIRHVPKCQSKESMWQMVDFQKCSNALTNDGPDLRLNYPKMTRCVL
jgi:hypothetical protein